MEIKGVNYDIGNRLDIEGINVRPVFNERVICRELDIIKNDLHCNAVRISGCNIDRLKTAATIALKQGLEVWLSPQLTEKNPDDTLDYILQTAIMAETLRKEWPNIILILGCELTLFMNGILEGISVIERINNQSFRQNIIDGIHNKPLNEFLDKANNVVRQVFNGQVTYASLPLEMVDWSIFDFVCVDYYRDKHNKDTYGSQLRRYASFAKPIIITEFGCGTYQGAEDVGSMGPWLNIDYTNQTINGNYKRDESLQAQELTDQLRILDSTNIKGVFVFTFVWPNSPYSEDPNHDLDKVSYSLVKSYKDKKGTKYIDMPWDPKESFQAVADYYNK